ncbi:uncharacterized protein TRIADDRAFT_28663 [Trichoplax adhaerens]|uniref:BUD13 homolog n=1 Tax=Trichoplax adhaerens TaxID=10228 RepID=B3S472_TRIAD|nr:hypothetical protein TRIADDRAFT_28663 [Trichoplax adhaerens]EDV22405.1 hypothetical protein TRIADDRAFT_28663 [Trichoplax adhaerens]|eukprot:XP_002114949.1 hypothetical protein TRIADDRAFT_28663 [Trichoplax adhaerens]
MSNADYLKKYLSKNYGKDGKKSKKKKNVAKGNNNRCKIIDDDSDWKRTTAGDANQEDIEDVMDDAPTVVDMDEIKPDPNKYWRQENENPLTTDRKYQNVNSLRKSGKDFSTIPRRKMKHDTSNQSLRPKTLQRDSPDLSPPRKGYHDSPDRSPPRRKERHGSPELSPPRRKGRHDSSDLSPPRRKGRHDSPDLSLPLRKGHYDAPDLSPPRRRGRHDSPDLSPPRRQGRHDSPDLSPRRKGRHDSPDLSPPRRKQRQDSPDLSPPRRKGRHDSPDLTPPRRRGRHDSPDLSPPRRRGRHDSPDLSRPRRRGRHDSPDLSSPRRKAGRDSPDLSPPRRKNADRKSKMNQDSKPTITKKAGLQSATVLKEENEFRRKLEDKQFDEMDATVSGKGAKTTYRDKHGKIRDIKKERLQMREERRKREEEEEKFMEWGKGMTQKKLAEEKLADAAHEINKPFARYADDADLDQQQREAERDGDPMLDYIKKKKNKRLGGKIKEKPKYKGPLPPPNRFNIMPGYRWDGVDRSNGFEGRRFKIINEKKSLQHEAYKWSTEDM